MAVPHRVTCEVVGGGDNWKVYLDKLGGPRSRCKWLIVVQTRALYESRPCLQEIYTALKKGMRILPVLFEADALQTLRRKLGCHRTTTCLFLFIERLYCL